MKRLIAPILLVAALAACGKSGSEGKSAAPLAAAPNVTVDGPAPGQWRMTTSMHGQAMPPVEICYNERVTFAEAQKMQEQAGITCSENTYKREGAAVVGHAVCVMEDTKTKVTTDTRITGDFNTAYVMELKSTMDPAPMPQMAQTEMQIKAERLGDCPAQ
jgi:hypothetical protein